MSQKTETVEGYKGFLCAHCGKEIASTYVVRGDQRYHSAKPECLKAHVDSGGGGVLAEITYPNSMDSTTTRGALMSSEPNESVKLYIAGSSKELERCEGAIRLMGKFGFVITCDWVAAVKAEGLANEGLDDEKRMHYAAADIHGVQDADLFWLMAPNTSTGAWTELGIALARSLRPCIVVSGPARQKSIFASLADYETDSDLDALLYILRWRESCRESTK